MKKAVEQVCHHNHFVAKARVVLRNAERRAGSIVEAIIHEHDEFAAARLQKPNYGFESNPDNRLRVFTSELSGEEGADLIDRIVAGIDVRKVRLYYAEADARYPKYGQWGGSLDHTICLYLEDLRQQMLNDPTLTSLTGLPIYAEMIMKYRELYQTVTDHKARVEPFKDTIVRIEAEIYEREEVIRRGAPSLHRQDAELQRLKDELATADAALWDACQQSMWDMDSREIKDVISASMDQEQQSQEEAADQQSDGS